MQPPLHPDCPSLRFVPNADLAALEAGDPDLLRPVIPESERARIAGLPRHDGKVALVLGANGFIGSHLVARLSQQAQLVIAGVRPTGDLSPYARLVQTMTRYQIADAATWARVSVLPVDPSETQFGLAPEVYAELARDVDVVLHCAGAADYALPYDESSTLRTESFAGLLRTLQFSVEGKRKHVTHISSVLSRLYRQETDFARPYSWWFSGYSRLKWISTMMLDLLAREGTFAVTDCTAPYVLGSTAVGLDPGWSYSWNRVLKLAKTVGMIWPGQGLGYIPVDLLAGLLAGNALSDTPVPWMAPCNPEPYRTDLIADLMGIPVVEWEDYRRAVWALSPRFGAVAAPEVGNDYLIRITNGIGPVFPPGLDFDWPNNRKMMSLYLSHLGLLANAMPVT